MIHGATIQEARLRQPTFFWVAQKRRKNDYFENMTIEYDSCKNVTTKYDKGFARHVPTCSL